MIITLIFKILQYFFTFIAFLLPDFQLPVEMINSTLYLLNPVLSLNEIFPILVVLKCIVIIITYYLVFYLSKLIFGFISILRGGGSLNS